MTRSLLDHPLLASRYFFPRRDALRNPFFVSTADGAAKLGCFRAAPHPDALTVLHFHGNAEVVADYVPGVANEVNRLGFNIVFAEYRGFGASTGTPALGSMLDDAESVFQAVDVPADRTVAFGRSLGSLFAVEVAARHPELAGLVLESAIADPLERNLVRVQPEDLGATYAELEAAVLARVDQRAKLGSYKGPLLVLHTVQDALIPVSHGQRLAAWGGAADPDKELVSFERGDHGSIFMANYAEYLAKLTAFLRRVDTRRR